MLARIVALGPWILVMAAFLGCGCADHSNTWPPEVSDAYLRARGYLPAAPPPQDHREGKESIYQFLDEGSIETANEILANRWYVPRSEAIALPATLTWSEDPFGDKYWRFVFYSLRPTRHLLYAFLQTGDTRYRDKLATVLTSFARAEQSSPFTKDKHGTAFRALVLVNTYWKLKRVGALDAALDRVLVGLIANCGVFLANPANFESDYNHGVTQAAALLVIAENFPGSGPIDAWKQLALQRVLDLFRKNVDDDGVQLEQSPGYHFYVLRFFWQIFSWADTFGIELGDIKSRDKLARMVKFATYIIRPDGELPLLGASSAGAIPGPSELADIERASPEFSFVRSEGKSGTRPASSSVLFPSSGFALLRSAYDIGAWQDATQLAFDLGPYRTAHSHLDALHLSVFAGRPLLVDSGLYTLEPGSRFDYFHGTRAHNTVIVDELDQHEGSATPGSFIANSEQQPWAYQSASHELYYRVTHRRGVFLLQNHLVLIIDKLEAGHQHSYRQAWHLAPDLQARAPGDITQIVDASGTQVASMYQLLPGSSPSTIRGQVDPVEGWYSPTYKQEEPATTLSFVRKGKSSSFVTLLASGPMANQVVSAEARWDDGIYVISLALAESRIEVKVSDLAGSREDVQVTKLPLLK